MATENQQAGSTDDSPKRGNVAARLAGRSCPRGGIGARLGEPMLNLPGCLACRMPWRPAQPRRRVGGSFPAAWISPALGLVLTGLTLGCGGQSKFLEDEDWTHDRPPDGGAWREEESLSAPPEGNTGAVKHDLNGVRLDLTLGKQAEPSARCSCLDVLVGQPRDPGFLWGPEVPTLAADQMVIAMRTEGTKCPAGTPEATIRRPSIRGIDHVGADVIVVVEELPVGRPLALGAVTTMPGPGGSVYVRPADHRLPYGVEAGARQLCKVYSRVPQAPVAATRP